MNPGLCGTCIFVRRIVNDRGSTFYHCGRAKDDPSFPKYPRLPVYHCRGFEPEIPKPLPSTSPT